MVRWRWTSIGAAATVGIVLTGCSGATQAGRASGTPTTSLPAATTTTRGSAPSSPTTPSTGPAPTATTSAPPDTAIKVYGDCTHPTVEPSEIILACADYNARAENLRWSSWTSTEARAVGTLAYNDCVPDCAQGAFHSIDNDHFTLTAPVTGANGQVVWSEIQEDPEPPGYATGPFHGGPQGLPTQPT